MNGSWRLLSADSAEASLFRDLETTMAHAWEVAAPPNRFRQVRRAKISGRDYFLKEFRHTQVKNRLRFRLTQPRCRLDGEREAAVAKALRQRDVEVARPVALGVRDGASFYICAGLTGPSVREVLATGNRDPQLMRMAAMFCGLILRKGVFLPDLSAEEIFLHRDAAGAPLGFAVIDLHNGSIVNRLPSRKLLRRQLRRLRRSVRDLPMSQRYVLGFVTRMLRVAGVDRRTARALIRSFEPLDTHTRYDRDRATRYRDRNPVRTARELQLLAEVLPAAAGEVVLDCPTGAGRLVPLLQERELSVIAADRARPMLDLARQRNLGSLCQADATHLPFADDSVDGVVVFRFLHHLDSAKARAAVDEACRVARRWAVVSFFHPCSAHGVSRRLRERISGKARTRHTITLGTLRTWMNEAGFELHAHRAQLPWLRDFWVASFSRRANARRECRPG